MKIARNAMCAALIVTGAAILSGCSVFHIGHTISENHYDDKAQLLAEWEKSAPWLPDDATDIKIKEATDYGPEFDPAILETKSDTDLDPEQCAEIDRVSSPAFTASWSPDTNVARVFVCGGWDVIAIDGGWFGWTANTPEEQNQSPRTSR